jgi:hypothetical protein
MYNFRTFLQELSSSSGISLSLVSEDNSVLKGQQQINDAITANMSKVFNGEMSVDDCLKDLKTKGDAAIANAK